MLNYFTRLHAAEVESKRMRHMLLQLIRIIGPLQKLHCNPML